MRGTNRDFALEIAAIRRHTEDYGTDPDFRKQWLGFTEVSRNYRAQQLRSFGVLMGNIADSLAGWRILDVGCGTGRFLRTLLEYDALPEHLVGVDVSEVRFASGRAKNPLITMLKNDGKTLPFKDGTFDLVTQLVCFSTIPTTALRQTVAREIKRVLKVGGYVFWWDSPNANIKPRDFFEWPILTLEVGAMPLPSECIWRDKVRRILGGLLDFLAYPTTHCVALIGPKPAITQQ
jgi:SAM-dependent methyltransferase